MSTATLRAVSNKSASGGLALGQLDDLIGFRLRRLQNQLSRQFAAETSDLGLRSGLSSSLAIIEANPGLSQSELSREIGQDKSITVTIVDELEKAGWALRERSKVDRRRHALYITPTGSLQLKGLVAILKRTEGQVLSQFSQGELHLLNELLDRMYAASLLELD